MIEPTSGTIWIDDKDTSKGSASDLRRGIGYVIQHAGLFPHRTIVDNVATVPFLLGQDKKQARARAMELLERVGLDPRLRRSATQPSSPAASSSASASPGRWPPTRR